MIEYIFIYIYIDFIWCWPHVIRSSDFRQQTRQQSVCIYLRIFSRTTRYLSNSREANGTDTQCHALLCSVKLKRIYYLHIYLVIVRTYKKNGWYVFCEMPTNKNHMNEIFKCCSIYNFLYSSTYYMIILL